MAKVRSLSFLFHLAALLVGTVGAIAPSRAQAEPIPANTALAVYRFYSKADLNESHLAIYKQQNGLFFPKQIGRVTFDFRKALVSDDAYKQWCNNLLEHLQNFSLHVYQSSKYLTKEQEQAQAAKVAKLRPETVTFLELSTPVPRTTVEQNPAEYPLVKMAPWVDTTIQGSNTPAGVANQAEPDTYQERKAVMWVLAGQFMYPFSQTEYEQLQKDHPDRFQNMRFPLRTESADGTPFKEMPENPTEEEKRRAVTFNFVQMPWETSIEDTFSIDRKKYPLTWELGRAAQVEPEHIETLFRAALGTILEDVETMQAQIEDGYVFVKAMDPLRARHFRQAGFQRLEGHCDPKGECVLMATLASLLERYPVSGMSGRMKFIEDKLNLRGNTTGEPATAQFSSNALRRIQMYFHSELDFVSADFHIHQEQPIILTDYSYNYIFLVKGLAETAGKPTDDAVKFANEVESWRDDFSVLGPSAVDAVMTEPFLKDFRARSIVRLTNLDENLVKSPNAIPLLLVSADDYLLSRYAELSPMDANPVLDHLKTKIAIQTTSPNIARIVRRFSGVELSAIHLPPQMRTAKRYSDTLYTFVFTREQIARLRVLNPKWSKARALQQGPRFFQNLSANPGKF